jgi:hypothetical protein
MGKRFLAAGIAAALVMAGTVVSSPAPSSADTLSPTEVSGNFAGDAREEVFSYVAGSTPDYLISFSNGGTSCGQLTWARYPHVVNGTYYPVAGNFDADPYDEIIWHAPGTGQDYLMNFPSFTSSTVTPLTVNGNFVPLAGDFSGDGAEDVVWYQRGPGQDYWWDNNPDGSRDTVALTVNGSGYRPIAGSFGMDATDDIHWYAPGASVDYFWDFVQGTHDIVVIEDGQYTVNGIYNPPFVLDIYADGWQGEDAFWYAPGPDTDYLWDYIGGSYTSSQRSVQGTYRPTSGDYFSDGHDDVLWSVTTSSSFYLWDHYPTPEGLERCTYLGTFSAGVTGADPGTTGVAGTPNGAVERAGS